MRWIGHRLRGEAEITVATDLTVAQGHLIASEAEQRMVQRVRAPGRDHGPRGSDAHYSGTRRSCCHGRQWLRPRG
ncbi:hypothetical protein [Pimelobacter simplex]|uniref:hypothetical protein n=1 Tax=Nocardioides simplex TaxID=2045 RepID=UPI0035ADD5ED